MQGKTAVFEVRVPEDWALEVQASLEDAIDELGCPCELRSVLHAPEPTTDAHDV